MVQILRKCVQDCFCAKSVEGERNLSTKVAGAFQALGKTNLEDCNGVS